LLDQSYGNPVVYEWEWGHGWRRRGAAPSEELDKAGFETIRFLRSLGEPQTAPGSLSDGLGPGFLSELLEALPDREPVPHEIEAFERSYRERHRSS